MSIDFLIVIPARGGSKGIPQKNIRHFCGKPLIYFSIDVARALTSDDHICVSTDDFSIKNKVQEYGLTVPFLRPAELAQDDSGMFEVLKNALSFYEEKGRFYETLILLQPTSPFRKEHHVAEALKLYTNELDMVASVKNAGSNPYFKYYQEDEYCYLSRFSNEIYETRQEAPQLWELNGAVYIINVSSLKREPLSMFKKIKKFVMNDIESLDLDTELDWLFAEFIQKNKSLLSL